MFHDTSALPKESKELGVGHADIKKIETGSKKTSKCTCKKEFQGRRRIQKSRGPGGSPGGGGGGVGGGGGL